MAGAPKGEEDHRVEGESTAAGAATVGCRGEQAAGAAGIRGGSILTRAATTNPSEAAPVRLPFWLFFLCCALLSETEVRTPSSRSSALLLVTTSEKNGSKLAGRAGQKTIQKLDNYFSTQVFYAAAAAAKVAALHER